MTRQWREHRVEVGETTCTVVVDGSFDYPHPTELLGRATDADLAMVTHFPTPGLGRVRETADGFAWQPLG